jgi:hypothetical protein
MNFLDKIRSLPEWQRKIILWVLVGLLALILFGFWIKNVKRKVENFPSKKIIEKFQLPKMPEFKMPDIKIPDIKKEDIEKLKEKGLNEEEIKKLQEELEKIKTQQ